MKLRDVVALCLLVAQTCFAQRYSFKRYGPDEGPRTAVNKLFQDRDGFLWVGTSNGLFRYDGDRFQRFGTTEGLPASSIRDVHDSHDGTLWAVTNGGLARFRNNRFTVKTDLADEAEMLTELRSDRQGSLYLGSKKGLLVGERGPEGEFKFHFADGVPKVSVQGVYVDPADGAVWFGCGHNLCRLTQGRNEVFGQTQGLPEEHWSVIVRDQQGNLWVRGLDRLYFRAAGAFPLTQLRVVFDVYFQSFAPKHP